MAFTVTSSSFKDGGLIPVGHTCDGDDRPPMLEVVDVPEGTRSFAIIMDDPDAPNGTFTHWLAYDIHLLRHRQPERTADDWAHNQPLVIRRLLCITTDRFALTPDETSRQNPHRPTALFATPRSLEP